jgi:large subunit ribosomal protein L23
VKEMKATQMKMNEEKLLEVIRRPVVTEKATNLSQFNKYVFEVACWATKPEVKAACEKIFKVDVLTVNTILNPGKKKVFKGRRGQRSDFKKAIVTVKQGQVIDASVGI